MRVNKKLCVICIACLTLLLACRSSDIKKPLEGKWRVIESQGSLPEIYLSAEMEFFADGTVIMSDFPGKKLPFKTELTKEERGLLKKNYPELEGKNIVLIMLDPSQHDWQRNAVAYQYSVAENELSMRPVIADEPTKYKRVDLGK